MKDILNFKAKENIILFVVSFAIFVDMLIYGIVVPFLPRYPQSLSAAEFQIGLLFRHVLLHLHIL